MSHALPALLLGVCTILGLVLVPLGLPGLWSWWPASSATAGSRTSARSASRPSRSSWASRSWAKSSSGGWDFGSRGRSAARAGRRGARSSADRRRPDGRTRADRRSVIGAFLGSFAGAALFEYSLSARRGPRCERGGRRGGSRDGRSGEDRAGRRDRRPWSVRRTTQLTPRATRVPGHMSLPPRRCADCPQGKPAALRCENPLRLGATAAHVRSGGSGRVLPNHSVNRNVLNPLTEELLWHASLVGNSGGSSCDAAHRRGMSRRPGPEPQASVLPGLPGVGAIVVSTVTSGSPVDPDGYTVTVDNGPSQHIAPTGVVTFAASRPAITRSCSRESPSIASVNGSVTVNVPLLGSVSVTFTVTCVRALRLRPVTSRSRPAPRVERRSGRLHRHLGRKHQPGDRDNGSVTFTGLPR